MRKKVLLPLELTATPSEAAKSRQIPPLSLNAREFRHTGAQSARPSYDLLVEREIKSARSSLYSEELENQRLEQYIRYLTERNAALVAEVQGLRQEASAPRVVEVLPSDEILSQNLRLEQENDYLRQYCYDLYKAQRGAASAQPAEYGELSACQEELERCYRKIKTQQQDIERQEQEIAVLRRLAGVEKPCLYQAQHHSEGDKDKEGEISELRERLQALEKQQRSGAVLQQKYAEARAEIRQLREELETEKGAFLEFVRMQRQDSSAGARW